MRRHPHPPLLRLRVIPFPSPRTTPLPRRGELPKIPSEPLCCNRKSLGFLNAPPPGDIRLARTAGPFRFGRRTDLSRLLRLSGFQSPTRSWSRRRGQATFRLRAETIGRPLTEPERSDALAELVEEELLVREALWSD